MTNPVNNGSRVGSNMPATVSGKTTRADQASESASNEVPASSKDDASTESSRLQQLRERIDSTPEVDMARVEQIKQALAEGRLPFDPQRVAQKFADLEGLLGD